MDKFLEKYGHSVLLLTGCIASAALGYDFLAYAYGVAFLWTSEF